MEASSALGPRLLRPGTERTSFRGGFRDLQNWYFLHSPCWGLTELYQASTPLVGEPLIQINSYTQVPDVKANVGA